MLSSSSASAHSSKSNFKHDSDNLNLGIGTADVVVPPPPPPQNQNNDAIDINNVYKPPPSAYSAPPQDNNLFMQKPPPLPQPTPPNSHDLLLSQPQPNQNNSYAIPHSYHQNNLHTAVKMEEGEVRLPPLHLHTAVKMEEGEVRLPSWSWMMLGRNNHHPTSWHGHGHGGFGRGGDWNEYTGGGNGYSRVGGRGQSHYHPYPSNPYHSAPSLQHESYYSQSQGTNSLNPYQVGGGNDIRQYNPNRVGARTPHSSSGISTQPPASYPYHHHHPNIHFGANNPIHGHPLVAHPLALVQRPMDGKAMHMSHFHSHSDGGIALRPRRSERVPAMSAQDESETERLYHQHHDSSTELFNKLPHELKRIPHNKQSDKLWVLQCDCVGVIEDGGEVGFLAPYSPQERDALFGVFGILRKKVPVYTCKNSRNGGDIDIEKKKSLKCRVHNTSGMTIEKEVLCDYVCQCKLCKVVARVARINCDGVTALLVYQLSDQTSGLPFDHDKRAHKFTQQEEQEVGLRSNSSSSGRSKYGDFGLSVQQRQFIIDYGTGCIKKGAFRDIATMMAASSEIYCSEAQRQKPEKLEEKVKEFVANRKRAGDYFFNNVWGKCVMSGRQLCEILDILKTPMESRIGFPSVSNHPDNFHLLTPDFRMTMWRHLVIHDHDHNGSTWSRITYEFGDWRFLLANALKMYPEGKLLQLEMDFFKGCCDGDEFQAGQCGFSDLIHRYFILVMDLSKSENQHSAGRLLERALQMLNELGGDCNWVLVDGGKALNTAIDNANKRRMENASATGGVVINIMKRACHAHMTRLPRSRGGGNRGAEGSIPKYLLEQGVDKETTRKIVGCMFLISCIPPSDKSSYKKAINLLINMFDEKLNMHVKSKYLNGEPLSLGGHMCGRPGEVASGQGMEKTGGNIKNILHGLWELLPNQRRLTKNPFYTLLASAIHKKSHTSGSKGQVAIEPNKVKAEILFAYRALKQYAGYIPPSSQATTSTKKRKNFPADFLYSFITTETEKNEAIADWTLPLHEVFGNPRVGAFTWAVPTSSCMLTMLSNMLLQDANSISGAPLDLQQTYLEGNMSSTEQVTDVEKLATHLSELTPLRQQTLKRTLHRKMLLDTPDPQEGEDFFDYVYRRAQRPVDPWALDTSHIEEVGSKVKARRKNKSEKRNRSNEMTLKQQREDELRRDKNDSGASGDLSDMMTLDQGEDRSEPNIVDHGGEDEEYYEQLNPEELIDELPLPREGKRIRVKRQLGDFTSTKVSSNSNVSCNCGRFSCWRYCEHCVYIDVLHFGRIPNSAKITDACDEWETIRKKFLLVLKEVFVKL